MFCEIGDIVRCNELGEGRVADLPEQSWWKAFCDVPTPSFDQAPDNVGASTFN